MSSTTTAIIPPRWLWVHQVIQATAIGARNVAAVPENDISPKNSVIFSIGAMRAIMARLEGR